MKIRKSGVWVLWYECIGFGLILLLTWLNELVNLPDVLSGSPRRGADIKYSVVETAVILVIWAIVFMLTRRLVTHLHHLEGFLRVCAWCRKVGYQGKWMPLEEYFAEGFKIETTHGMCPECLEKIEEDTKRFYREQMQKQAAQLANCDAAQKQPAAPPQKASSEAPGHHTVMK